MARSVASDAPPPRVTIRHVAERAGVGIATVSRVLNDSGYTTAHVRDRVWAAARSLGYFPSQPARSLRSSRSLTIAVVVPDLVNPVHLEFLRGVEHGIGPLGYVCLVADTRRSAEAERRVVERLTEEHVAGVVLAGPPADPANVAALTRAGVHVVPPLRDAPARRRKLLVAEESATRAMARHLLGLGHRHIALFAPRTPSRSAIAPYRRGRRDPLRDELTAHAGTLELASVDADNLLESCRRAVDRLWDTGSSPTACVAGSHVVAPGVLSGLTQRGLRIPTDVSFVTFGDSDWALACRPPLAVVRQNVAGQATYLAGLLMDAIHRTGARRPVPDFGVSFVPRESCGPPPQRRAPQRRSAKGRTAPPRARRDE